MSSHDFGGTQERRCGIARSSSAIARERMSPTQETDQLSCFGKLFRARTVMYELGEAQSAFRDSEHYRIARFDNAKDSSDPYLRIQWRYKVVNLVPSEWAFMVGDAVNNMRSALDHSVAEIARRQGMSDLEIQNLRLQYPICDTPSTFAKAAKVLTDVIGPDLVERIRQTQPFLQDSDDSLHNLAMLRDLSNLDKHRQVSIVAHGVFRSSVELDPPLDEVRLSVNTGRITDGAVLATAIYKRPVDPPELQLRTRVEHVESLNVPWSDETIPLAVVLELMYEEAITAVESVVREVMGPTDFMYMRAHIETAPQRLEALTATLPTPVDD